MNHRLFKYFCLSFLTLMTILFTWGCAYEKELVYTSPEGSNTIVVKYDLVSRPYVFKRGALRDEKIWNYPNSGFQETVNFDVEWLGENQIRLTYDDKNDEFDEEYIISIPV